MPSNFQELDYRQTPLGELILRRRRVLSLDDTEVYEVKLAGEFLMSSLVNQSEVELARVALAELGHRDISVLVGGLGLGHTADAALDHPTVRSVTVVEHLEAVIEWHRRGLVPLGERLCTDQRCSLVHGDFFSIVDPAASSDDASFRSATYDAILVDIDHSPRALLSPTHAAFYEPAGLHRLAERLNSGGVFGLWSADPPDDGFTAQLAEVFATAAARPVSFYNPLLNHEDTNVVYVARK